MDKQNGSDDVYVVTQGSCSDYSIDSIWTDRIEAERQACRINARCGSSHEARVEVCRLNKPDGTDRVACWTVRMQPNGVVVSVEQDELYQSGPLTTASHLHIQQGAIAFDVWARSSEQAVKAANERRIYMKVSGLL